MKFRYWRRLFVTEINVEWDVKHSLYEMSLHRHQTSGADPD